MSDEQEAAQAPVRDLVQAFVEAIHQPGFRRILVDGDLCSMNVGTETAQEIARRLERKNTGYNAKLADDLQRLCCAETEAKFFDCVTDNIGTIIAALRNGDAPIAGQQGGQT